MAAPKGNPASPDTLFGAFRIHLFFLAVFGGSLASSFHFDHSHPAMTVWASLALAVTAAPIIAWRWTVRQEKRTGKRTTEASLGGR